MLKVTGKLFWTALPVLAMAVCPQAHAQLFCSNAMLEGSFAVVILGQSGVPANPAPRSGVSMTRFDGQGGLTLSKEFDVPLLGKVPFDPSVGQSGDRGIPISISNPESPQAAAFKSAAEWVAARISVMNADQTQRPVIQVG